MASGYPDYEGNKRGLYSVAEWATLRGLDKVIGFSSASVAVSEGISEDYAVPAGKNLFITSFSWRAYGAAEANRELNQFCQGYIQNITDAVVLIGQGANGGAAITPPQPIVIPAGETVRFWLLNLSNHAQALSGYVLGYELDA